jgi:hypothetical protein
MIMAALHTVNHNKLFLTRYPPLRQIKSGSEQGAVISTFGPADLRLWPSPTVVNKRCYSKPDALRGHRNRYEPPQIASQVCGKSILPVEAEANMGHGPFRHSVPSNRLKRSSLGVR